MNTIIRISFFFAILFFAGNLSAQTVDISKLSKISAFTGDVVAEFSDVTHVAAEIWKARSGDKDVAITVTPGTPVKLTIPISADSVLVVTYTPNTESPTAIGALADGTQVFVTFEGAGVIATAMTDEEIAELPDADEVVAPILAKAVIKVNGRKIHDLEAKKKKTMFLERSYFLADTLVVIGAFNLSKLEKGVIETAVRTFKGDLPNVVQKGLKLSGTAITKADFGVMFYLTPEQLELVKSADDVEIRTRAGSKGLVHKLIVDGVEYTLEEGGVLIKEAQKAKKN